MKDRRKIPAGSTRRCRLLCGSRLSGRRAARTRGRIGGSFRPSLKLSSQSPPTRGRARLLVNAQNQSAGFSYTTSWSGGAASRFFQPCLGLVDALEGSSINKNIKHAFCSICRRCNTSPGPSGPFLWGDKTPSRPRLQMTVINLVTDSPDGESLRRSQRSSFHSFHELALAPGWSTTCPCFNSDFDNRWIGDPPDMDRSRK